MTRLMMVVAALVLAMPVGACATLTRGTTQAFVVETTPAGAAVKTSTGYSCPSSPCTFTVQRKEPFTVTLTKDGYVTHTAMVKSEMAGSGAAGMAGNVLFGGLIGVGVDATSGALNDLTPNPLQVVLQPAGAPAAPAVAPAAPVAAAGEVVG